MYALQFLKIWKGYAGILAIPPHVGYTEGRNPQGQVRDLKTMFYPEAVPFSVLINVFFLYSFLGWVMECIVIRREKGIWENRGFTRSPFCIIYGFGAMLGYAALRPFAGNVVVLYFVGALAATGFEFLTARAMLRFFGEFWWDYSHKRFNYKGMLCLESTIGWGLLTSFVILYLHHFVFWVVRRMPPKLSVATASLLSAVYLLDFACSFRQARQERFAGPEPEEDLHEQTAN